MKILSEVRKVYWFTSDQIKKKKKKNEIKHLIPTWHMKFDNNRCYLYVSVATHGPGIKIHVIWSQVNSSNTGVNAPRHFQDEFEIPSLRLHSELVWAGSENLSFQQSVHTCPGPCWRTAYSTDFLCETKRRQNRVHTGPTIEQLTALSLDSLRQRNLKPLSVPVCLFCV